MEENQPTPENLPSGEPIQPNNGGPAPLKKPAPAKRRKKRWWLRIPLALLALVILVVVLAPTILSMGWARSMALSYVSDNFLNGHVEAEDWSLGWTSGLDVQGLKIFDDKHRPVATIKRLSAPVSFIQAMRTMDFGEVVIDSPTLDATIEQGGRISLTKLIKSSEKATEKGPGEKSKLPKIRGTVRIVNAEATIAAAGSPDVLYLKRGEMKVVVPSLNDPIDFDVKLPCHLGETGAEGTLLLAGNAKVFDQDEFNIDKLAAKAKLDLSGFELAAANPFLNLFGIKATVGGRATGNLNVSMAGMRQQTVNGQIDIEQASAGGALLNGDKPSLAKLGIPIDAAIDVVGQTTHVKFTGGVSVQVAKDGPVAKLAISADTTQEALQGAAKALPVAIKAILSGKPATQPIDMSAGTGYVKVDFAGDIAPIINQLPHSVRLQDGMSLTKGTLTHGTHIELSGRSTKVNSQTTLPDLAGKQDGKDVAMAPIAVTVTDLDITGGVRPNLTIQNAKATVGTAERELLTVTAGGAADGFQADGKFIADALVAEAGKFVQVDEYVAMVVDKIQGVDTKAQPKGRKAQVAGTGSFHVGVKGDIRDSVSDNTFDANAGLQNFTFGLAGQKPLLYQPSLTLDAKATLLGDQKANVTQIKDITVTFKSGEAGKPTVSVTVNPGAGLTLATDAQGRLGISKGNFDVTAFVDVPQAQQQYAALLPALEKTGLKLISGTIDAQVAGTLMGKQLTLEKKKPIKATNLALKLTNKEGSTEVSGIRTIDLAVPGIIDLSGEAPSANVNLDLTLTGDDVSMRQLDAEGKLVQSVAGKAVSVHLSGDVSHNAASTDLSKLAAAVGTGPLEVKTPKGNLAAQSISINVGGSANLGSTGAIVASLSADRPVTASGLSVSYVDPETGKAVNVLNNETINLDLAGEFTKDDKGLTARASKLALTTGSNLIAVSKEEGELGLTPAGGVGKLKVVAPEVKRIDALARLFGVKIIPRPELLESGSFEAIIALLPADQNKNLPYAVDGFVTLKVPDKQATVDEKLLLSVHGQAASDLTSVAIKQVTVKSAQGEFLNVVVNDVVLVLGAKQGDKVVPVGLYDMVQKASGTVTVKGLDKLDALLQPLTPASQPSEVADAGKPVVAAGGGSRSPKRIAMEEAERAARAATQPKPLPPLEFAGDGATATFFVARSGQEILSTVHGELAGLVLRRGQSTYKSPKPITFDLTNLHLGASAAPGQQFAVTQLSDLKIDKIAAELDGAKIESTGPMSVTNLGKVLAWLAPAPGEKSAGIPQFVAKDVALHATGDLASLSRLLEVLQAKPANTLAYAGSLDLLLSLAADEKGVGFKLACPVNNFSSGKFSERLVNVSLDGAYSFADDKLVASAKPTMQQAGAKADCNIVIKSVTAERQVEAQVNALAPDADKLWEIIHPMLLPADPQAKDSFADLKVSGGLTANIKLTGKYPKDAKPEDAIRQLAATGGISFGRLQWQGMDLSMASGAELPVHLADGRLAIEYPDAKKRVASISFNNGELNLGGTAIELGKPRPMVSYPAGQDLLKNATLGPILADKVGMAFPILLGSKNANGILSVRVNRCQDLPLDWFSGSDKPDPKQQEQFARDTGGAVLILNLRDLSANSIVADQLSKYVVRLFPAAIRDGKVTIEHARIQSDIAMDLAGDRNTQATITGGMLLDKREWDGMQMVFPKAAIAAKFMSHVPSKGITLHFKGPITSSPDIIGDFTKSLLPSTPQDVLDGIMGGNKPPKGGKDNTKDNDPANIIKDLFPPKKDKDKSSGGN